MFAPYYQHNLCKSVNPVACTTALKVAIGGMLSVYRRNLVTCGWVKCNQLRFKVENALINESQHTSKRRSQFVVKLKAIENAMGFFLLLFFQPPLLTSDLLTDQKVTRSKEVTLSSGNKPVVLVGSSLVGPRVVAFEEVSWIDRLCKNEVILMAGIEAIYCIT